MPSFTVAVSSSLPHLIQVDLKLSARGQKGRGGGKERDQGRRKAGEGGGGGHAFSATNPYGKKATGDARQFTH